MLEPILDHVQNTMQSAVMAIVTPLPFFVLLALAVKGRRLLSDAARAASESRTNLLIHFTDALMVVPVLVLLSVALHETIQSYDLVIAPPGSWGDLHPVFVGIVAVFLGDFIGYWRHRAEHSPLLWPSHAIHHSDTEMTWLAIFRFHPINRLTTVLLDSAFILAMGLPAYAVLVNGLVRHYYGAYIHADLPWTYGPLKYIFVSPAMHRWHHANDPVAYGTNYATVFSIFDQAFGTFRVPGPCTAPLGVPERMGAGFVGQLVHPFKPSSYRFFLRSLRRWRSRKA